MRTVQITDKITLIHGDCMDYLAGCGAGDFGLAICDPPYGIGENGDRNASRGKLAVAKNYKAFAGGDSSAPEKEYFAELCRVSKNQIIWGANHFADRLPCAASSCWLVWDKMTGASDFADCELAYTSFKTAVRQFTFQWSGMLQGDMKNKEHRIHPTQKPVKLYDWIYANYAEKGQRILDTHLGSGSNAIAAHYAGMDFFGIELDEDYFNAAVERVRNEIKQEALF